MLDWNEQEVNRDAELADRKISNDVYNELRNLHFWSDVRIRRVSTTRVAPDVRQWGSGGMSTLEQRLLERSGRVVMSR